jgi:5-methylcytosine-specific restriction endonuclease McrA
MNEVREGTVFTADIDRVSGSGNGIIELNDGLINIGPTEPNSVGEQIKGRIEKIDGTTLFALCVSEKHLTSKSLSWAVERFRSPSKGTSEKPSIIVCEIDTITNSGNPLVRDPRYSQSILVYGSTEKIESGDIVKIHLRSSSFKHNGKNRADFLKKFDSRNTYKENIKEWVENMKEKLNVDDIRDMSVDIQIGAEGCNEDTHKLFDNTHSSSKELESLREQAKKESVENISESDVTTTQTTQQYRRSQEVRDYVMARADGVCEGCGEPAPFTSKTGEPYLHAHHVHELSDGGSDTPDTVIALCPNCHYRVHHGVDGDEYNQELVEKVLSIEDT